MKQIAAGTGLSASQHSLFKLEDIAVAAMVEAVGSAKSWKIEYLHDAGFNYNGCSNTDVISHYIKPNAMLCMQTRAGDCCKNSDIGKPHLRNGLKTSSSI